MVRAVRVEVRWAPALARGTSLVERRSWNVARTLRFADPVTAPGCFKAAQRGEQSLGEQHSSGQQDSCGSHETLLYTGWRRSSVFGKVPRSRRPLFSSQHALAPHPSPFSTGATGRFALLVRLLSLQVQSGPGPVSWSSLLILSLYGPGFFFQGFCMVQ